MGVEQHEHRAYEGRAGYRNQSEPEGGEMTDTQTLAHLRPDHEDCECVEQLDHDLYDCDCPGYPLRISDLEG